VLLKLAIEILQWMHILYSWLFSKQKLTQSAKSKNLNFEKFIFRSSSGFKIIEKSVPQITRLCLPRTCLLIRMAYEGLFTTVGWQLLISGNPAFISGNDEKKWFYDGPD